MNNKVVIVIEDNSYIAEGYLSAIKGRVSDARVVCTDNLDQAKACYESILKAKLDIVAIVVDGCVPGENLNTIPLIEKFVEDKTIGKMNATIIAASSDSSFRTRMLQAGCTAEARKEDVPDLVCMLLSAS